MQMDAGDGRKWPVIDLNNLRSSRMPSESEASREPGFF
jgi:hypothetical protein